MHPKIAIAERPTCLSSELDSDLLIISEKIIAILVISPPILLDNSLGDCKAKTLLLIYKTEYLYYVCIPQPKSGFRTRPTWSGQVLSCELKSTMLYPFIGSGSGTRSTYCEGVRYGATQHIEF